MAQEKARRAQVIPDSDSDRAAARPRVASLRPIGWTASPCRSTRQPWPEQCVEDRPERRHQRPRAARPTLAHDQRGGHGGEGAHIPSSEEDKALGNGLRRRGRGLGDLRQARTPGRLAGPRGHRQGIPPGARGRGGDSRSRARQHAGTQRQKRCTYLRSFYLAFERGRGGR